MLLTPDEPRLRYRSQMAAFTALRRERVAYVDTAGSFTWSSFSAMADALPKHAQCAPANEAQHYLDLFRVYDLHDLLHLLHALSRSLDEVRPFPSQFLG